MNVRVRAPVRIDFAGGWSDVPAFADEYSGAVVNIAITRYVVVEAQSNIGTFELVSDEFGQHVTAADAADFEYDGTLDLHKAAVKMIPTSGGVRLVSFSRVPPGSGLGTSGALDVALVAALIKCSPNGGALEPMVLAEQAFRLEAVELGLMGGRQDQYAAAIGGCALSRYSSDGVQVKRLQLPDGFARELQEAMVLVYTGQTHFSSETHHHVWTRFHDGAPDVNDALHTLRDLAEPTAAALESGDLSALARLIDANWSQQQRLHSSIATRATRAVETAARRAGALGAKATGAGAGGCMIFIGPPNTRNAIVNAVQHAGGTVMEYGFDTEGVRVT